MSVESVVVDQMAVESVVVDQMVVDQMAVDQMAVDQMAVDQMAVDQMAVGSGLCWKLLGLAEVQVGLRCQRHSWLDPLAAL